MVLTNRKEIVKEALHRGTIGVTIGVPTAFLIFYIIYISIKYATGGTDNAEMNTMAYMLRLFISFYVTCFLFAASTVVYQIEKLPLVHATAIHFATIFSCWMLCAWLGDWVDTKTAWYSWLIAAASFIVIYAVVWAITYHVQKKSVAKINEKLNH
ncbi:MAG: DUF3021 domain-containing protein [Bacilli bacterium]|jgi:hypothetical protein|nr:DUF3021 domain-containing protein [Bacilli bacterium]